MKVRCNIGWKMCFFFIQMMTLLSVMFGWCFDLLKVDISVKVRKINLTIIGVFFIKKMYVLCQKTYRWI